MVRLKATIHWITIDGMSKKVSHLYGYKSTPFKLW